LCEEQNDEYHSHKDYDNIFSGEQKIKESPVLLLVHFLGE
jgi:hypothetical protein